MPRCLLDRRVVHCLMEWPLLSSLSAPEQRLVLARMHRRRYARGETLFHEGDLGEAIHFIQEGRVVSRRTTRQGDTVTFALLGPGDVFGEMAMLAEDHRRSSTISAIEVVVTQTLRFDEFQRLCEEHPAVQGENRTALGENYKGGGSSFRPNSTAIVCRELGGVLHHPLSSKWERLHGCYARSA